MNSVIIILSRVISTLFFVGYIPFAPGSFGALAAALFVWFVEPSISSQLIILPIALILGIVTSGVTERELRRKDCKHIVIDEFVGYLCAIAFLPLTLFYLTAAFILFRFFDILKPPPINLFERIGGGAGIMLDDVAAGIMSNILLQTLVAFNIAV